MTNISAPVFEPDLWDNSLSPEQFLHMMTNFYASNIGIVPPSLNFVQFLELMAVVEKVKDKEKRDPNEWEKGVIKKYLSVGFNKAAEMYDFIGMSDQGLLYRSTCYQYARNDMRKTMLKSRYDPGGEAYAHSWPDLQSSSRKTFKEAVISACESDGLSFSLKPHAIKSNYYGVGFYVGKFLTNQGYLWDSHFTREDADGGASHKMGFTKPEKISAVDTLKEPNYDFEGYLLCPVLPP